MLTSPWSVSLLALAAVVIALVVTVRPQWTRRTSGKVLAFFGLFLLPILTASLGAGHHLERAKTTEFCLSCHEMAPYGESLWADDGDMLAAAHFQNRNVPRETACYSCHTDYTMFGDINAKMRGLRHVWVHYFGEIPEELALYSPYQNRECLHCHAGARSFEENEDHVDMREDLASGDASCLECHDLVHAIADLEGLERWQVPEHAQ